MGLCFHSCMLGLHYCCNATAWGVDKKHGGEEGECIIHWFVDYWYQVVHRGSFECHTNWVPNPTRCTIHSTRASSSGAQGWSTGDPAVLHLPSSFWRGNLGVGSEFIVQDWLDFKMWAFVGIRKKKLTVPLFQFQYGDNTRPNHAKWSWKPLCPLSFHSKKITAATDKLVRIAWKLKISSACPWCYITWCGEIC